MFGIVKGKTPSIYWVWSVYINEKNYARTI